MFSKIFATYYLFIYQALLDNFILIPYVVRQGRCVLMPRYLRPLAPPPTILNKQEPGQQQAEAVAWSVLQNQFSALDGNQRFDFRFVSLIPHTATNAYFPGLGDVWPTSEQFLRMMVGTKSYVVPTKALHPGGHRGRARSLTY